MDMKYTFIKETETFSKIFYLIHKQINTSKNKISFLAITMAKIIQENTV